MGSTCTMHRENYLLLLNSEPYRGHFIKKEAISCLCTRSYRSWCSILHLAVEYHILVGPTLLQGKYGRQNHVLDLYRLVWSPERLEGWKYTTHSDHMTTTSTMTKVLGRISSGPYRGHFIKKEANACLYFVRLHCLACLRAWSSSSSRANYIMAAAIIA